MMETLYAAWREVILHLWQSTLILLPLLVLGRSLSRAPARISYAFWSLGFLKLFLPLSLFGLFSGWAARVFTAGSHARALDYIPSIPAINAVLDPVTARHLSLAPSGIFPEWAAAGLTALWFGGLVWLLSRAARELVRSSRYSAVPFQDLDDAAKKKLDSVVSAARVPRDKIMCCRDSVVPAVVGIVRPRIVVPCELVRSLADAELLSIVLHEDAHRRRFDPARQLLYRTCASVLFFYPLLPAVLRRLRASAEFACDEIVLSRGISPSVYSRAILKTVALGLTPNPANAAAVTRSEPALRRRTKRLFTITSERHVMKFKHVSLVAAAALFVAAGSLYPLPMAAGDEKSKGATLDVLVETTDENTQPPKLIESVLPEYPAKAAAYGLSAGVVLKAVISTKGTVKKLGIVQTYVKLPDDTEESVKETVKSKTKEISKMFSDSALEAARTFKFKPATRDGTPVEITVKIPFQFNLH